VVAVVSCVAQLHNVIAPFALAATNSKVFMITRGPCAAKANRTERDQELMLGPPVLSLVVQSFRASVRAYFTFKVIFFVRFPSSGFVEYTV
jgi:hypothetical protein